MFQRPPVGRARRTRRQHVVGLACALTLVVTSSLASAAAPQPASADAPQYVAPNGRTFFAEPDTKGVVAAAQSRFSNSGDLEALRAVGDAHASLFNHREAIAAYTKALALEPENPILLLQRGHRRLSNRDLAGASADLTQAVTLDPSLPGAWYYLGLAHYLEGRFDRAAECYEKNIALAQGDLVAAMASVDWLYMSYRRGGQDRKARALLARITPEMKVEGNIRLYFNRLLFYKGLRSEADLLAAATSDTEKTTLGYRIGNFHLYSGHRDQARRLFEEAVGTTAWPTLAFIAAERDLGRMK